MNTLLRAGVLCAATFVLSTAISSGAINALAEDRPAVEHLFESQTTNLGQAIAYPSGTAQITAVIVSLEPGEETGRHRHPVPLYAQVLEGQVTVDYGAEGRKTYKAGEAFMEAMDTWHNGRNTGDGTLRILAVFMGAEGVPNVERP